MKKYLHSFAILLVGVAAGGLIVGFGGGAFGATAEAKSTCQKVVAQWEKAYPESAKPQVLFTGEPAAVKYAGSAFPGAVKYRTQLDAAVADGVDFAGKYAIAQWGCGTRCQEHAMIDVETGDIVAFGLPSEAGISVSAQHAVLVTNPRQNLPSNEQMQKAHFESVVTLTNIPREYYVLAHESGKTYLKKLCTENPFEGFDL